MQMLKFLGLHGRPYPNGWIRLYDYPDHLRIACLGLQVEGRHHTEYHLFVHLLDKSFEMVPALLGEGLDDLPESAVETSSMSMSSVDD
jgi:hypothetical protein